MAAPDAPAPFAVAFFYKPTRESAIAAGVRLPVAGLTIPVSRAQGVAMGVLCPISPFHIEPTAADGSSSAAAAAASSASGPVSLPAFMYPSTASIHPKHLEGAEAFVRFEQYPPGAIKLPQPVPGQSYSAILYPAGRFDPGQSLKQLPQIEVHRTSELRSVLRREGPIKVKICEIQSVSEAPVVFQLVRAKTKQGWECSPEITVLSTVSFIHEKASELVGDLLPQLVQDPEDRNVGRTCKRRLNLIKKHSRRVRKKVVGDVISRSICKEISRAITDVQSKKPELVPSYLQAIVPSFIQRLTAELARSLTFVAA